MKDNHCCVKILLDFAGAKQERYKHGDAEVYHVEGLPVSEANTEGTELIEVGRETEIKEGGQRENLRGTEFRHEHPDPAMSETTSTYAVMQTNRLFFLLF